ncbi:hypothetical protein [Ferrimonas lipolytica]|uniref:Nucleoside-specific outer membrane channel protein Tsx n=1 Tax=Ferrimonas lipolytica TaxID=2724191 RepID=A0A6H1UEK1_9GAMM|nr:hypothetical protein [Ferrimonas lipolytica]QIZ77474.1 hypothetical protein HER31_11600 [Ferrimonas lipolytica]
MKKLLLAGAIVAAAVAPAQAEILKSNFQVGVGYWFEVGTDSEASNQGDETVITAEFRAKTDWGSSMARGLIENIGSTKESPNGLEIATFKTFSTTLYDLDDSNFSVWIDHQTVSNTKIADNHLRTGFSYAKKFGDVAFRMSLAPEYYFGHSPQDDADSIHLFGRTTASYAWTNKFSQMLMFENVNFRNERLQDAIGWKEHGYHYMLMSNYAFTKDFVGHLQWHHFKSFGGYKYDGTSLFLNFTYKI